MELDEARIGVIGLGYVGLPLAVELGRHFPVIGFDVKGSRILELSSGKDSTLEVTETELLAANGLKFSSNSDDLERCNVYIVTVPTPIGPNKRPILTPLKLASRTIGNVLQKGDLVVYESTVYPGCTEEICVPVLEKHSSLKYGTDFSVGYSPERINPGDKVHRLPDIKKVVSGSSVPVTDFLEALYGRVVTAGIHRASSIRVAEAAKVIENTQRDVNIALVNELALIFDRLNIDTGEVLEAAGSKWNFLPFKPGLVGGHCIGVDPYYLTHKAQEVGYRPEMILAGRRLNDAMGEYVASRVIKLMIDQGIQPIGARILVLGLTFKENCPDVRNTRVVDLVRELQSYRCDVSVYDPWASPADALAEHDIELISDPETGGYDALVLAVAHRQFTELGPEGISNLCAPNSVVYDVKHALPPEIVDGRL